MTCILFVPFLSVFDKTRLREKDDALIHMRLCMFIRSIAHVDLNFEGVATFRNYALLSQTFSIYHEVSLVSYMLKF